MSYSSKLRRLENIVSFRLRSVSLSVVASCIAILGVAFLVRFAGIDYGIHETCLAATAEDWLYSPQPVTTLYTWSSSYRALYPVKQTLERQIATQDSDFYLLRLFSVAMGLITVAGITGAARRLGSNWWWAVGLWTAIFPTLIDSGHYILRFSPAVCAVSLSLWALVHAWQSRTTRRKRLFTAISSSFALSLLLAAPPLWWLSGVLIYLQPVKLWRLLIFVAVGMIILDPGVQNPAMWIGSTQLWDAAATSICVICLTMLIVWKQPNLAHWQAIGLFISIMLFGGLVLMLQAAQRLSPNSSQWDLIHLLQDRVADGSLVQFDPPTYPLVDIIRCPHGPNLQFVAQPQPLGFTFLDDPYPFQKPSYIVTTDPHSLEKMQSYTAIDGRYYVGYNLPVAKMMDIHFGNLFSVLNGQIENPTLQPGSILSLRFDYQFLGKFSVDALRYHAFVHVIVPERPDEKLVDFSVDFVSRAGDAAPRRLSLDQEYGLLIPADVAPGKYQVIFGVFDIYTGQRLVTDSGQDTIQIGEITIDNSQ